VPSVSAWASVVASYLRTCCTHVPLRAPRW